MDNLIKALFELLKSDLVKNNIHAIIVLLVIVALLSGFIVSLIMNNILFPYRYNKLNNRVLKTEELIKENNVLKERNAELEDENERLKNEILEYQFMKSTINQDNNFKDKALDGFVKRKRTK